MEGAPTSVINKERVKIPPEKLYRGNSSPGPGKFTGEQVPITIMHPVGVSCVIALVVLPVIDLGRVLTRE